MVSGPYKTEALAFGGVGLGVEHVVEFFGAELEDELVEQVRVGLQELGEITLAEEEELRGGGDFVAVEKQDVSVAVTTRAGDDHVAVELRETGQEQILCPS
jgi:hypothetical protein